MIIPKNRRSVGIAFHSLQIILERCPISFSTLNSEEAEFFYSDIAQSAATMDTLLRLIAKLYSHWRDTSMNKNYVIYVYRLLIIFCAFYTGALGAYGQLTGLEALKAPSQPKDTVHTEGVLSVDKVQPGSTFQIAIVMTFDEGWHANANPAGEDLIPTQVVLPEHIDLQFGEVIYPRGDILEIASIGKAPVYHDQAIIGVQATLGQNAQLQKIELPFKLTYQACSDEQCLLPKTVGVNIPMEIVGTDQPVQPINAEIFSSLQLNMPQDTRSATSETGEFRQALSRGYFWAFLLVFTGGILTSLTPCVYPLIPITVSIFGANREASRTKSFLLSVTYVLGIAVMYSILGVAVASTGARIWSDYG